MTIKKRNLHSSLKHEIQNGGDPSAGFYQDFFVDGTNGSDTGFDGKSWDAPFKTITEALTAADLDSGEGFAWIKPPRIFVGPGDYDEGAVLTLDIANMKLKGLNTNPFHHSTMIYSSSASHHLAFVENHNIEIADIGFVQTKNTYDAIRIGDNAAEAWWKLHIHNCKFDGYGTGEYAIAPGGSGALTDAPDIVIENNHFRSWATACVLYKFTRGACRYNTMVVPNVTIGIDYRNTGGNRGDSFLCHNEITCLATATAGIKLPATEPTDGKVFVYDNAIGGTFTVAITKGKGDAGVVNNPAYADGTAFAQHDPS